MTTDHSYGHPGTQGVGDPRSKTREMTGQDVSAGFSREKSRPLSRPFPCTQLRALGVPRSGGAMLWGCHTLGGSGLTFTLQTPLPLCGRHSSNPGHMAV